MFNKALCFFLGHKYVEKYSVDADGGLIDEGKIVFYECARCKDTKIDFKVKLTTSFGDSVLSTPPSQMRMLNEHAEEPLTPVQTVLINCADVDDADADTKETNKKSKGKAAKRHAKAKAGLIISKS